MKFVIAAALALLVFSVAAVGTAGNARSCQSEWMDMQTSSGATFAGIGDCAKYAGKGGVLYKPLGILNPTAVGANQIVLFSVSGLHASSAIIFSGAVEGQPDYFSQPAGSTDESGAATISFYFPDCGIAAPYRLVLTLTDSFGVHASAELTLC